MFLIALLVTVALQRANAAETDGGYAAARRHYTSGQWQLSAQQFSRFLATHGNHPRAAEATVLLAESLVNLRRYAEARQQYVTFLRRYVATAPEYEPRARFLLGYIAHIAGQRAEARELLEAFCRRFPEDGLLPSAATILGDLALEDNDGPSASEHYQRGLDHASEYPQLAEECLFGLAQARELMNDHESARQLYARLLKSRTGRLADRALYNLALLEYEQQDYAAAAKRLTALESEHANSTILIRARYLLGLTRIAQGEYAAAAEVLKLAARDAGQQPLSPAIAFRAAEALRLSGNVDEATAFYQRTAETWPDSKWAAESLCGRLRIALKSSDHRTVNELYADLSHRFPNNPCLREGRQIAVRSLLAQNKYDQAIEQLQSFFSGVPTGSSQAASYPIESNLLGRALLGAKRHEEALQALDQIDVRDAPSELAAGVSIARARTLIGLERYSDAVAPMETYLELEPNGPEAPRCWADLVTALAHTGQIQQAWDCYRKKSDSVASELHLETTRYLAETAAGADELEIARELFAVLARPDNPADVIAKGEAGLLQIDLRADAAPNTPERLERRLADNASDATVSAAAMARAEALEKADQRQAALRIYELVVGAGPQVPHFPHAVLAAARLHEELGQTEQAMDLLSRLVRQQPTHELTGSALYQQAEILLASGQTDEAGKLFAEVHREWSNSPHWPSATLRLAESMAATQQYQRALELSQQLLERPAEGTIARRALYLRGQVAASRGEWSDVIAPMQRLIAEYPDDPQRLVAEYWIAEVYFRLGDMDEATTRLETLTGETRDRTDSWLALIPLRRAQILARTHEWSEAYALASSISLRFPEFSQQYEVDYLLGRCLAAQAKFREARAAYQRVISSPQGAKSETAAMAQWMIGETFFHQKNYDDAIPAYLRVEILHDYPQWKAAGLLQAGKCYETRRDYSAAVELYARLLSECPDTPFRQQASERLRVAPETERQYQFISAS